MTDASTAALLASVVVTNHDYARYLGDAVASALAQTHAPLEVVVVDDGSSDGSRDVIRSFGDRVTPVLKDNGGMGSALNAGFRASRGEVVLFLDSDDVLLPGAVATAIGLMAPEVVKVHWQQVEIDAEGRAGDALWPRKPLPEGALRDIVLRDGPMSADAAPTSGNAWSRAFLDAVLPMPEARWRVHADSYLNTLASVSGRVCVASQPQGRYRVHGANDWATRPLSVRSRRTLAVYHERCRLLADHFRAEGLDVQPGTWKRGNRFYDRLVGRVATLQELESLIPPGTTYAWIDEGAFGPNEVLAGRRKAPFRRFEGRRGFPDTDEVAIAELERLRQEEGADFLVVARPALWWLRVLAGFDRHLRTRYRCDLTTDTVVVFDLRKRP